MPDDTPAPDQGAFELEPLPEPVNTPAPPVAPSPQPPRGKSGADAATPGSTPVPEKAGLMGRLGGMLEDFDEDADFEHDPEVEAATGRKPPSAAGVPVAPERPAFVRPGSGSPSVWVGVSCVLLLGAVIGAAVNEPHHPVVAGMLAVYDAGLHTCTGVAALGAVAMLLRRPLGPIELAAARMLAAVCGFLVIFNLKIDLIGTSKWEELLLGAAVYVGAVALLFRIWKRPLMYVICAHFLLWMVVQIGMQLSGWLATAPAKP